MEDLVKLARSSFSAFCLLMQAEYKLADHLKLINSHLMQAEGGSKRLIVNMPPRSGKSLTISKLFPAWFLGRNPDQFAVVAAYGEELAVELGRFTRDLMRSDNYLTVFPHAKIVADSAAVRRFNTVKGGGYYACSTGMELTGKTADLLVIDDPVKNQAEANSKACRESLKDWFNGTAFTRLMPTASIVIVMQRWHESDLSGHLLYEMPEIWEHLNIPAFTPDGESYWKEQWSKARLLEIKRVQGTRMFDALYMQSPSPIDDGMFNTSGIEIMDKAPPYNSLTKIVRYWDRAGTVATSGKDPDYTVGLKMGIDKDRHIWILDMVRVREHSFNVQKRIYYCASVDGSNCVTCLEQDPGQAGVFEVQHIAKLLIGFNIKIVKPTGSKQLRAEPVASSVEAGIVKMVKGNWNRDFLEEVQSFPFGRHDDIVDAFSGGFTVLSSNQYNIEAISKIG